MHNFLISFATITAIGVGALLYRLIENEFGSNIGFLAGFIIITVSAYFINTRHW
ncbi:MAG: hypothetical protein GQ572_05080 [Gammaproteobacteria bacterium]|nr:hypothetical protein [Gammaproteobacteria bacterium]